MHGKEDDFGVRGQFEDHAGDVEAVEARHCHVEQHNLGPESCDLVGNELGIGNHADHIKMWGEQHGDRFGDQKMVVSYEDSWPQRGGPTDPVYQYFYLLLGLVYQSASGAGFFVHGLRK